MQGANASFLALAQISMRAVSAAVLRLHIRAHRCGASSFRYILFLFFSNRLPYQYEWEGELLFKSRAFYR